MTVSAFVEIQFPPNISAGAKGGPGFNTSIAELSSGAEKRNINWARERPEYDVSTGLRDIADVIAYQKFFYARRGRAVGFRFKDWGDYRLPFWRTTPGDIDAAPTLFTTNAATAAFQIYKVYSDAGGSFARKIVKVVSGSVALYHDAVLMTQGTGGSQYQIDLNTGIVTLGATVTATTGHLITGHLEFDVPARFDTDKMQATLNGNQIVVWDSIPIVGLKL